MLLFIEIAGLIAHVFSWIAVCHALLTKHDPRAALGWTVTALFLPVVGPILYACFGISRAGRAGPAVSCGGSSLEPDYAHPPFSHIPHPGR